MDPIDEPVLREFETWLTLFTESELADRHKMRAWFCIAEFIEEDFDAVSRMFTDVGATASFAFLGRDAEDQAPIIEGLADRGHEVALHSYRHHRFSDLSYDEAHGAISKGLAAIEAASGTTPTGFFPPFLELSSGAMQAVSEFEFDWVLGTSDSDPGDVTVLPPVTPFDNRLLYKQSPEEVMDFLRDEAAAGGKPFLFHPPVIDYYDGLDVFEQWVRDVGPVSIGEQVSNGGTGVLLDCIRPVRVT